MKLVPSLVAIFVILRGVESFSSGSIASHAWRHRVGMGSLHASSHGVGAYRRKNVARNDFAMQLRPEVTDLQEQGKSAQFSKQNLFLTASTLTYAVIIANSPEGVSGIFTKEIPEAFIRNLPAAIICFGGADILTQQIERSMGLAQTESLDVRRVLSATAVGIVCNAFGLAVWLHYLGELFPVETINVNSVEGWTHLVEKSLMHSWVWGTLGNTIALVGRRLLAGDSWDDSVKLWSDKIFPVTQKQLFFWPAWQAMNFALVPTPMQAQVTGAGSFFFNVFMSWVASSGSREALEQARMEEEKEAVEMVQHHVEEMEAEKEKKVESIR